MPSSALQRRRQRPSSPPLTHTQVGLTAGPPGCATDAENYGYFTRLSDPAVLEQVIAWLNSREGTSQTGLDDAVRAWMVAANEYLQLGAVPAEPEEASPQEP